MKKKAKALSLALAGVMMLSLAACSGKAPEKTEAPADTTAAQSSESAGGTETTAAKTADGKQYKIGVLQLVQHTALDASNKGFIQALDDAGLNYTVDQQNASGDQPTCQTIASKLVNDGDDLILAIATPAAQAVAGATSEIPVLVTAVTDPAASDLVESNDMPGGNISGTSDLTPVKEQISLLKKILPDAKTVGILYCTAESNSEIQAKMAKEAIEAAGMTAVDYTVSSSNEIQTVVTSMVGKVDAIYAPTDNTIAAGMATVAMIANENKLPTICGEDGMVKAGGLATYGIDYYELGYLTGLQAVKILTEDADVSQMPIEYLPLEKCKLSVNEETAKALGIDLSGLK
ncbi:ABC transporter substrate-binding protein [Clostridium boliviensis]|uniref:ABC transporter substrate-binding protein n=1 Tax=Clostridium boliviensis TaxID=318465 RepID=A0ABU4GFR9_9CLOT|nr:ABC transporter substrate-binding protein [Clostridium boliviensis]MDW2796473.1 ABC transporter substrate-binding protein [Clostridium boliviensis]